MTQFVVMPKFGNTVESCILVSWKVSEGDAVDVGTVLCEIETDKSTMDVPAGIAGTVLRLLRSEGDDVPVLEPIAAIEAPGEGDDSSRDTEDGSSIASAEASEDPRGPSRTAEEPPRAPCDPLAHPSAAITEARGASPRAKAAAREAGIPLDAVAAGSGPGGRIIERDIRAAAPSDASSLVGGLTAADIASGTREAQPVPYPGAFVDTPIKGVRKLISDRMMSSLQSSAQLTLFASAPADRLLALRARFKESEPSSGLSGITIGDLVAFAAARTLVFHPKLNALALEGSVREFRAVHLGLAVDTPRGLLVPVVRNASSLSLREFSAEAKRLAAECVSGGADPGFLAGSTFTVTNLGAFGIEQFTPILNAPEVAILGVGAAVPRPAARAVGFSGGPGLGLEMRIGLSLTIDHRIVDGADGARYLAELSKALSDIDAFGFAEAAER